MDLDAAEPKDSYGGGYGSGDSWPLPPQQVGQRQADPFVNSAVVRPFDSAHSYSYPYSINPPSSTTFTPSITGPVEAAMASDSNVFRQAETSTSSSASPDSHTDDSPAQAPTMPSYYLRAAANNNKNNNMELPEPIRSPSITTRELKARMRREDMAAAAASSASRSMRSLTTRTTLRASDVPPNYHQAIETLPEFDGGAAVEDMASVFGRAAESHRSV